MNGNNNFKQSRIVFLLLLVGLPILFILGVHAASRNLSSSAKEATITEKQSPASAVAVTPQELLNLSGSSGRQTDPFTTHGDWTMTYTFDCSQTYLGKDNFVITVENTDGSSNSDLLVNELAASGGSTNHYYDSGEHYLKIDTGCNWTVAVKG